MHVETISGINVPVEFQDRYPSIRYHKNRVKNCVVCGVIFYDCRERPRPPNDKTCHHCLVKELISDELDVEKIKLDQSRTKSCTHCFSKFLDRSILNTRIYCYDCAALYSPEFLQSARRTRGYEGGQRHSSFWQKEPDVLRLCAERRTDTYIADTLHIKEHQVRMIRLHNNIKSVTNDENRVISGFKSLSTLNKDEFIELYVNKGQTLKQISSEFGVNRGIIKRIKHQLNVVRPVMGYKLLYTHQKQLVNDWRSCEFLNYHVSTYSHLSSDEQIQFEDKLIGKFSEIEFPIPEFTVPLSIIRDSLSQSNIVNNVVSRDNSVSGITYLDTRFKHRFEARTKGKKSAIESWSDSDILRKCIRYCAKNNKPFTPYNIRRELINVASAPAHFKPAAAASVMNHFKPESVLDPTIGWGGRTLAALCCKSVRRFYGIDLQSRSVDAAYRVAYDFNSDQRVDFTAEHNDCLKSMETLVNKGNLFDLILTSPPFFNTEDYGVDSSNDLSEWYNSFVLPFVTLCTKLVGPKGHLAIHLEDIQGHKITKIFQRALYESGLKQEHPILYNKDKRIHREQLIYIYSK